MSTRGIFQFTSGNESYCVYKHHDCYPEGPHGGFAAIAAAAALAWQLPRFEPDEFAAAFVAANKDRPGGLRLTNAQRWEEAASADCEYAYVIDGRTVKCLPVEFDEETGEWDMIGPALHATLAEVIAGWWPAVPSAA